MAAHLLALLLAAYPLPRQGLSVRYTPPFLPPLPPSPWLVAVDWLRFVFKLNVVSYQADLHGCMLVVGCPALGVTACIQRVWDGAQIGLGEGIRGVSCSGPTQAFKKITNLCSTGTVPGA